MRRTEFGRLRLALTVQLLLASLGAAADGPVAIAIHGGAGTVERAELGAELESDIRAALERALRAGHDRLLAGDSATVAVTAAIVVLEDSPHFNAGHGAVFNANGQTEMDAAIMDGRTRNSGAVTGVLHIRNPILLAERVMSESRHVMLAGSGAEEFALSQGIALVPNDYFHTERRRRQLEQAQATADGEESATFRYGTVGAVALDSDGNLAAATSTGGMTNKRYGRIGDSPIIGAGTYADNRTCAVSATGHGEYFIRAVVAHDIAARMRYGRASLEQAVTAVIHDELPKLGGSGGVIAMDGDGTTSMTMNTRGMYRGAVDTSGRLTIAIYADEAPQAPAK